MAFGRLLIAIVVIMAAAACQRLGLTRQYEYDERVELALDGSATVDVNASIPALVALRGATLSTNPEARFDRNAFRGLYEGPGVRVRDVSTYRRHGRRFVHVRLVVDRIEELAHLVPLSWSRYRLERLQDEFRFLQELGPSMAVPVGDVGWTGRELVAFRLHLPSRINFHSPPSELERGNILVWEQTLRERLDGVPLTMEARMDPDSILYTTLWLFGGTFVAAMAVLAAVVWMVSRKGRRVVPA